MHELQIVRETIDFYTSNNRSKSPDTGACVYNGPNNKCCAFSRLVKPQLRQTLNEFQLADAILEDLGDKILQQKYQGQPIDFYLMLQRLHDRNSFWDEKGLNKEGYKYLRNYGFYMKKKN